MHPGWQTKRSRIYHYPKHGNIYDWDLKQGFCKENQSIAKPADGAN